MPDFKITGNSTPTVGEKQTYSIADNFLANIPSAKANDLGILSADVHWSIYELRGNSWIHKKKNDKTGPIVQYSFFEATIKYEGLKLIAEKGGEKATLIIKPQSHVERKIVHVDFLDALWNKPTQHFAYGDKVIVRIHCVNLNRCRGTITLWEDEEPGASHNSLNKNNKAMTLPIYIEDGKAEAKFFLSPSFAQMANKQGDKGTGNEGEFHEYYVTVEIFNQKTFESQNINIANPDYKKTQDKPIPAEQKGPSKKEEKGIKSNGDVHDYYETSLNVLNEIRKAGDMVREVLNKPMIIDMPDEGEENTNTCVCKENNFYWSNKLTCEERKKVIEVCTKLWGEDKKKDKASELMAIMHLETGKKDMFKPYADNGADYSGLIQFNDASAKKLGTTRSALKKMTFIEQMNYVHDYFASKQEIANMVDLYLHVLKPNAVGNGNNPDYVLFDESISVPDGDGSQTSAEQRKINIGKEPWVTKYGYSSNPSFMKGEEHTQRMKWVYTRQRFEERWGFVNGKTTVADVMLELNKEHYNPGVKELFKGVCENAKKEDNQKENTGERAPWMKIAWEEETKKLKETGSNKEIQKFFDGTPYEQSMKNGTTNESDISWCATFVNWVMTKYGYKGVEGYNAVRALKWANWAEGVDIKKPIYGAIAVKRRTGGGHVGFVAGKKGNKIVILGGNQNNALNCSKYSESEFFAYLVPKDYEVFDEDYKLPEYEGNPNEKGSES
jgi:uncharacterized protein (TIGR02594 family)